MGHKNELAVGLDVGGSHVSGGLVALTQGGLIPGSYVEKQLESGSTAGEVLNTWVSIIHHIVETSREENISKIGIAVPGPFDYRKGIALYEGVFKYDSLFGVNIKQYLLSHLKNGEELSIDFINDATAFALGEDWGGGAQGFKKVLALTLGSGFGSTFLEDGKPLPGGKGIPEGGFLYSQPYRKSCADDYFSTRWFLNKYKALTGKTISGVKDLAECAQVGDSIARDIFKAFGKNLAEFLSPFLTGTMTQSLIIGGNISRSWEFFMDPLVEGIKANGVQIQVQPSILNHHAPIIGAVRYFQKSSLVLKKLARQSTQFLAPAQKTGPSINGYDIYPAFPLKTGTIQVGYESLAEWISHHPQVVIDGYVGVFWDDFMVEIGKALRKKGKRVIWKEVGVALKPPQTIDRMIAPYLGGDDPLFGKRSPFHLEDFFQKERLQKLQSDEGDDINIIIGCGAALVGWDGPLIYVDLPKNELQFRLRSKSIFNLGATKPDHPKAMYKRFYFVDWPALNRHKQKLLPQIDIIVDGQRPPSPTWSQGENLRETLSIMSRNFFRPRPWFEPGPWGGQWIAEHISGLNEDVPNYAWSFELITPENGLTLEENGNLLEVSFDMLMYQESTKILGEAAERFGSEFPIRFDFLDTFEGGNLSVQCHPRPEFINEHFGENFTQDETYYILDAKDDANVYLGFQDDIDPQQFRRVLEDSCTNSTPVEVDKYVQTFPAKKHDLFLIPNGTIHCSGTNNMVLEISATPYIFTFKMYDWLRRDLEGNPRPLNIEKAFQNLYFDRKGEKVKRDLISKPVLLNKGQTWKHLHFPTHEEHFYDVYRYDFEEVINIETRNQCHVMMLVSGSAITLETRQGYRQRFNYAETFIVPAAAGSYTLSNEGPSPAKVVQAFVKTEWCCG